MSASTRAGAAARPRAQERRPGRADAPDLSTAAMFGTRRRQARSTPLFVYVGTPPGHTMHTVRDLGRQAGDEADRVLELTAPDGASVRVADCAGWGHECTCDEFRRRQDCGHIRALEAAGALELSRRFGLTIPAEEGGRP